MKNRFLFALPLVASLALPVGALAQQSSPTPDQQPAAQSQPAPDSNQQMANATTDKQLEPLTPDSREGFWGHMNPFARKKYVQKHLQPIRDRANELDELTTNNSRMLKDVDARATAGINKAQTTADAANQTATAAGQQAQQANTIAGQATGKVEQIHGTVDGLDKYAEKNTVSIAFRRGSTVLSADDKKQLDDLAASLTGHQGYLLEVEAHAPGAGSVGIQNSDRLAEVVKRYLVTQHEIPVYRMHAVALGNAPVASADTGDTKPTPVRTSYVELRLMENSLAAQDGSTPRLNPSQSGASQP